MFCFFSLNPAESEGNSWFDVRWKCAHTAKWKSEIKRKSTWRSTRLWSTKFCQCTFKQFLLPIRLFLLFKTSSDRWIAQPNFEIGDILRFRKNYFCHVKLLVWHYSAWSCFQWPQSSERKWNFPKRWKGCCAPFAKLIWDWWRRIIKMSTCSCTRCLPIKSCL